MRSKYAALQEEGRCKRSHFTVSDAERSEMELVETSKEKDHSFLQNLFFHFSELWMKLEVKVWGKKEEEMERVSLKVLEKFLLVQVGGECFR